MLRAILERSLRHRAIVLALAAGLLANGVLAARHAKLDVLPDFAPPQAEIQTEAPGLAPEQVERLVTGPVESALGGLAGLRALRSESIQGLSVVRIVFDDDTDVHRARQLVAETLGDAAPRLPAGVHPPHLSPLTSATMDVLKFGLTSDALSPMALRALAEWTVRPQLLMVPGVARVNLFGGETRQLQVRARADRLRAHGTTLADLDAAARSATAVPGAGFLDTPNQRIVLQSSNLGVRAADLARTVVRQGTTGPVRLGDVADVAEGAAPRFGDALIDGRPGVLLTLSAAYGANTVDVTRGLETALADLQPLFDREGVTVHPGLHRPADFVEASLRNLRATLLLGSALVVAVLLAFLRNRRAAAITLLAIPLSLLTAVIVLTRLGFTLDTMSLGGLAIAIGEVVDDAIIDVENILRRLRENAHRASPASAFSVVLGASLEIRGTIVFATLAVAMVFLPLLALKGLPGKFFAPLALGYLIAVGASLGVALSVTPALALALFSRRAPPERAPTLQLRLRAAYLRTLERLERRPLRLAAPAAAIALLALVLLPFLGGEFLPDFQENHLVVQIAAAPGTSLGEMRRIGERLSARLLSLPGVRTLEAQIGRAEAGEDTWGPNRAELHVELRRGADGDATEAAVRAVLETTPGLQSEVLTFLGDRISETLSGETAEIAVNVFSEDLDALDRTAADVARVLAGVPGAVDVQAPAGSRSPQVSVRLRPERLQLFGLRPTDVLDPIRIAFAGASAGQVMRGSEPVEVTTVLAEADRSSPLDVGALPIASGTAGTLPLRSLADVSIEDGRDVVSHEGGRRRETVTCNVKGRDVTSFADEARRRIGSEVTFPSRSYFVLGGTADARAEAVRDLALNAGVGLLGLGLLLSVPAGHWRNLGLLLANAPFALAGGVIAAALAGLAGGRAGTLSLGSLVGFVTVFGVTTRNALMMISHYRHLVEVEGRPWSRETALEGAADRVVPVAMTTLVTSLALLPVALRAHAAGGEIDGPMAIVILGGLVVSSLLNLGLLPWLALRFGRFPATSP